MIRTIIIIAILFLAFTVMSQTRQAKQQPEPMKIGVVGLVHTHVHWILGRANQGDFTIVGIVEPNRELAQRYAKQYGFDMAIVFDSIEEMLAQTKPEAMTAFNTIRDHLAVVEVCAPKGIHVMVEKPLAVNLDHAKQMAALARQHNIHLLTNYETTWYPTNHKIEELMVTEADTFGAIRKIVVHDGHPGPKEIGVDEEFLEWLTDPYWNGAGALTDFGCYGANLSTWLQKGAAPTSVFAVTQQIKPEIYPKVDDEATIVLTYPKSQTIIQASWNWNYNRKDMEVYCERGYLHSLNREELKTMRREADGAKVEKINERQAPYHDPFAYLIATIRGDIQPAPHELSSLENNLMVMKILEAARISAKEGRRVELSELD